MGHGLLPDAVRAAEEPDAGGARRRAAEPAAAGRREEGRVEAVVVRIPARAGWARTRTRQPPRRRRPMPRATRTRRRPARSSASLIGGADSQFAPGAGVLRLAGPQARRRCAERARAELHRRQSRAALRRVVVRQDLPRGKARADQGEARGFRARAGRVPARAADHQRRRKAERARADVERVQRVGGEDQRRAAEGRGAVPGVQGQSGVRAADGREQVDRAVAGAADEAAGRVPGPAPDLQARVSQDAAAEGVDRRDRQEDQGRDRDRAAFDRGHLQRGGAAGSERRGEARRLEEGRARPAGPQHPVQHPEARGRHQPLALRRAAAAAEGSGRRGRRGHQQRDRRRPGADARRAVQAQPDAEPADRGRARTDARDRARVLPRVPRRHAADPRGHGAAHAPAGAGRDPVDQGEEGAGRRGARAHVALSMRGRASPRLTGRCARRCSSRRARGRRGRSS